MERLRRVTLAALLGAAAAIALVAWLGPSTIGWYYAPPVAAGQTMFSCEGAVNWALHRLVLLEGIAAAAGALLAPIVGAVVKRLRKQRSPGSAGLPNR